MKSIKFLTSVFLLGIFVFLSLCCASSSTVTTPAGKDDAHVPIENINANLENIKS